MAGAPSAVKHPPHASTRRSKRVLCAQLARKKIPKMGYTYRPLIEQRPQVVVGRREMNAKPCPVLLGSSRMEIRPGTLSKHTVILLCSHNQAVVREFKPLQNDAQRVCHHNMESRRVRQRSSQKDRRGGSRKSSRTTFPQKLCLATLFWWRDDTGAQHVFLHRI